MNVLFITIDSLRFDILSAYRDEPAGFGYPVETDNLDRFSERAVIFESHYAGSLPCMPARREWLAGFLEFPWRPWGPLEPFDRSLPRLSRKAGAVTQLITDHYHYYQHGAQGYFEDFNGHEFIRGHEWDPWKTSPVDPDADAFRRQLNAGDPRALDLLNRNVYVRNTEPFETESDWFAPRVFSAAAEWLRNNLGWDKWFCYVDSFDVHEPFDVPEPYASMYTDEDPDNPEMPVWPIYGRVDDAGEDDHWVEGDSTLTDRQLDFVRAQFAGKTTMVDRWFGRILDVLDEGNLWADTMVVITSDHGHYLGDHGWMGKPYATVYDTLAHTPLLIWHPESPRVGERVSSVTSAVDLYATILDGIGAVIPDRVHSQSLMPLLRGHKKDVRDWALYGYWGSSVNVTDGHYTYHRPASMDGRAGIYSTMMLNEYPHVLDPPPARTNVKAGDFLPYTDVPVWQAMESPHSRRGEAPELYDVRSDPDQLENLAGTAGTTEAEERMRNLMVEALEDLEVPSETFERVGLDPPAH